MKLRLIKLEGSILILGKGIYNTENTLCVEKTGKIFKSKSIYCIDSAHIKRNKKSGLRTLPYVVIDLATHLSVSNPFGKGKITTDGKSIDLASGRKDIKIINQVQRVTQASVWEARQKKLKHSKWEILMFMFAGMGLMFLITSALKALGVYLL